eukprot:TRINITY_DN11669_c0_g1_i1.p1 TRINITY_DN11669_c0_g1~~TRINITY_DN11669_c0_g1_i1.p1  ORF type:complete len:258 (+),score=91.56 TRINITY_DN11669_c0_g1_i1:337-1110(+)
MASVGDTPVEPVPAIKWTTTAAKGWSNPTGQLLRPLDDNIWVAERTFHPSPSAPDIGGKTTIIKLADGSLFVHNPLLLTRALADALAAVGPVSHIVSASLAHHGYMAQWLGAYPDAVGLGPPGLAEKCPHLPLAGALGDTPVPALAGDLEQVHVAAVPAFSETVFFHRPTRTVLVTDLLMHFGTKAEGYGLGSRLLGSIFRGPVRRATRSVLAKDKAAFRAQIGRVAAWEADRLVMAHGTIVEGGVGAALRDWFPFL